jgi:4-alpha-glucanotransferase
MADTAPMPPLFDWLKDRAAGVLLHPTALPGPHGIGTLNGQAVRFLDLLQVAGMKYWQVCPLGPTGFGDSPYQCFSSFAGNPYLVDLHELVTHGLLDWADLAALSALPADRVDFGGVYQHKWPLLVRASERYEEAGSPPLFGDFDAFRARHADWLEPYAFFRALKDRHGGRPWWEWPVQLRSYQGALGTTLRAELRVAIQGHVFTQYAFFGQWARLRQAAATRGIGIIGDIPIFVAADSADTWANPELFELDPKTGRPLAVAGVPPDYFAADGQLWGNPLYRWERHAKDGYAWWINRLKAAFAFCDVLRIDHFRGFDEFWRIPYPAETARRGAWTAGPGIDFFRAVKAALPNARIIAEDLGMLSPSVVELREATGLPGMAVLQFAFGDKPTNLYLPHNLVPNSVIYPGTHDNDTTLGWYAGTDEKTRDHVRRYLRVSGNEIGWDFIRASYGAVSRLAVIPFQDILNLGAEARFNAPGKPAGNWQWRCSTGQIEGLFRETAPYLASLGEMHAR